MIHNRQVSPFLINPKLSASLPFLFTSTSQSTARAAIPTVQIHQRMSKLPGANLSRLANLDFAQPPLTLALTEIHHLAKFRASLKRCWHYWNTLTYTQAIEWASLPEETSPKKKKKSFSMCYQRQHKWSCNLLFTQFKLVLDTCWHSENFLKWSINFNKHHHC